MASCVFQADESLLVTGQPPLPIPLLLLFARCENTSTLQLLKSCSFLLGSAKLLLPWNILLVALTQRGLSPLRFFMSEDIFFTLYYSGVHVFSGKFWEWQSWAFFNDQSSILYREKLQKLLIEMKGNYIQIKRAPF